MTKSLAILIIQETICNPADACKTKAADADVHKKKAADADVATIAADALPTAMKEQETSQITQISLVSAAIPTATVFNR